LLFESDGVLDSDRPDAVPRIDASLRRRGRLGNPLVGVEDELAELQRLTSRVVTTERRFAAETAEA
jgi:hypothetical protein